VSTTASSTSVTACKRCGQQPLWVGFRNRYECPNLSEHDYEDLLNRLRNDRERGANVWNQENG
jgi:hypothetical protein